MSTPVIRSPKKRVTPKTKTTRVIGIDPSLTRSGYCVLAHSDGTTTAEIGHVPTKGHTTDSVQQRHDRLDQITDALTGHIDIANPDLVLIEGPSFNSRTPRGHEIAGLWWRVVGECLDVGYPVVVVPPTCRMKYATGKGQADKETVMAAAIYRYHRPDLAVANNDQADALIMAAMGMRFLGAPIEVSLPQTHIAALDKIVWPS